MCAPAIIPVLATAAGWGGATVAGLTGAQMALAVAGAAASGLSAGADAQAAEFNENVAIESQKVSDVEAENVRIAGAQEAGKATVQARQNIGRQVAQFGASGINPGTGTALDIATQTAEVGALESMTILNNAERQAFGLEERGRVGVETAKQQKKQSYQKGGISILGSFASPAVGAIA